MERQTDGTILFSERERAVAPYLPARVPADQAGDVWDDLQDDVRDTHGELRERAAVEQPAFNRGDAIALFYLNVRLLNLMALAEGLGRAIAPTLREADTAAEFLELTDLQRGR